MSKRSESTPAPAAADHLEAVEDGCGCAEVWEQLSEQRRADEERRGGGDSA